MRPGARLEVLIEKGVYRGLGLARAEGQVVFVPRALPGDRWRVRVVARERGYLRAEPEALLARGPGRRPAPCAHASACGGCAYQELGYAEQLVLKEAVLRESLRRAGAAWDGPIATTPSPEAGWRSRATFHVDARARSVRVGLHAEGSRRVVELARCLQVSEAMNAILDGLRRRLEERLELARRIENVSLAEGSDGAGVVACLEGRLGPEDAPEALALAETPGLAGLGMMSGPPGRGRFVLLRGVDHARSVVLGISFRAHVRSFFQGNRFLVEPLAARVVELVEPGGSLLDLFAGVGLFALALARRAERVVGVEASASAVEDAVANAREAGLAHVRFREADAAQALASLPVEGAERIVLDPPRAGAGPELCRAIAERAPEAVVYVSCDPPTLGRDLQAFARAGYRPRSVDAFDMFPDTFHLETISELRRG
jgi:23S rRNA (uracil1939-C5)-methyltransferase